MANSNKKLTGRPFMNLTESQIRYAMSNTWSTAAAARFLNVCYNTYTRYAKQYIDSETGKTLFELHKSKVKPKKTAPIGDKRKYDNGYKEKLDDILAGKYPDYQPRPLRKRLFLSGIMPMECSSCGWNECRVTDGNYPLYLAFKDGNWKNKLLDNIYLLCFNCYFCQIGSLGSYYQGISYGTRSKKRADGNPRGWKKQKKNPEESGSSGSSIDSAEP